MEPEKIVPQPFRSASPPQATAVLTTPLPAIPIVPDPEYCLKILYLTITRRNVQLNLTMKQVLGEEKLQWFKKFNLVSACTNTTKGFLLSLE